MAAQSIGGFRIKPAHFRLLSSVALLAPVAAHAQPVPPPAPPPQTDTTQSDQTVGQTVQTTRTEKGEIIVTARHFVPEGTETATKSDIPLIQTPQSISVVTRDQIDLLNFVDAQQAVRYTSGVFGENYGPDPRYDFITVRGFTPKQYIDGLAVPATTTISSIGVDLYAFQSLDILKGPASVLYGAAPPGGILNEVSRRALPTFGGEAEIKAGNHSFYEGAGTVTGPLTPFLDARITALYRDSKGEIEFQHNKRLLLAPTATLKLGSSTRLTGLFYYQHDRNQGGNGGFLPLFGTLVPSPTGLHISRSTNLDDPKTLYIRHQWGAGYDFEHRFGHGIAFHSNTKWSDYDEKTPIGLYSGGGFTNTTDPTMPSYYRTLQQYNFTYAERVKSFATDNRFDAKLDMGDVSQELLAGIDYRNVRNKAAFNFVFAGQIDAFNPVYNPAYEQAIGYPFQYNDQRLKQTGIYGQDHIGIDHKLFITLGARNDWVNISSFGTVQKEHKFTYRAGVNYVTDLGIAPYLSYSTSFEPVLGTDVVTKQPFKPTSVNQWEGGVKYDARALPSNIKLFATAALFDIKEKNFVVAQVGPTPVFNDTQGGEVKVKGFELELVTRINQQLSINASYSYNHSKVISNPNAPEDVGYPLPTTPKNKLSLFADYTIRGGALAGLGGGLGLRYNSASAGTLPSGTFPAVPAAFGPTIVTGKATLFDAILHYDQPHFRIAINASNLFDKNYVARCTGLYGCVYGAGRQVIATLTGKF
ncbi:MAG TPA: TonB-dependent siderophore receptor [Sphingomicrobium sp.]|nr:TonB-dependent siderophore receptor [Sphingomicrobium sp.]